MDGFVDPDPDHLVQTRPGAKEHLRAGLDIPVQLDAVPRGVVPDPIDQFRWGADVDARQSLGDGRDQ